MTTDAERNTSLGILGGEILLVLLAFYYYRHLAAGLPLVANDSASYLYFHPTRPVGYPFFLEAVHGVFGSYKITADLQLALAMVGIFAVARGIGSFLESGSTGLFLLIVSIANLPFLQATGSLLSEPLSFTLICAFTTATLHFVKCPSIAKSVLKSIFAALAITVRPVNIVLVLADIGLVLVNRKLAAKEQLASCALSGLLTAAALVATPLTHFAMYGSADGGSPLARGLFQKAFYVAPVNAEKYRACVGSEVFDNITAARAYTDKAPPAFRRQLEYRLGDYIRFEYALNALAKAENVDSAWKIDDKLRCYFAAAWAEHPFELVKGDLREFFAMLTLRPFLLSAEIPAFQEYLTANPPPMPTADVPAADVQMQQRLQSEFALPAAPPPDISYFVPKGRYNTILSAFSRLAASLCNLAPIVALAMLLWTKENSQRERLWVAAGLGLITIAGTLITSVSEFGLARYVLVYWTTMWASFTILALAVAKSFGPKLERRSDP